MEELNVIINPKKGEIVFSNFNEIKEQLSNYLAEYKTMIFTEESKSDARAVVVDLRELKKEVNDRKVEVKKQYMQPYDAFEAKTKELLLLIEEPIHLIDSQIQIFEKKRIEERKLLIQEIYDKKSEGLSEYAPLSRIYSEKWENVSITKKKIEEEMEQAFLGIKMDVDSLKLMRVEPDVIQYALDQYKRGSTTVDAMRKANEFAELAERRKEAEERAREAQEAREVQRDIEAQMAKEIQAARAAEAAQTEDRVQEGFCTPDMFSIPEPDIEEAGFELPFVTPSTRRAVYHIVATENDIAQMELYMNSVGIGFERIE